MKWWNEYNNIVTLEFPGADLKKLDLNKVVSELYSNKISVICAFANSYYPQMYVTIIAIYLKSI